MGCQGLCQRQLSTKLGLLGDLLGEKKLYGLIQILEPVCRVRCLFYALGLWFCSELLI